jgi:GNAT superfamily N-acetyltransferase
MSAADIPLSMRLKEQAGWNQTEADWQRFLDLEPEGCFVAEFDSVPTGTLTTCTFGPVAWVAMVLVDQVFRGRGIAKKLLAHALEFLNRRGIETIRLDATPLGQPLYERLGFVEEYRLHRFEGILHAGRGGTHACPSESAMWHGLTELDREVTGTDRARFLCRLFAAHAQELRIVGPAENPQGYLAVRRGSRAVQIGPCIADADAGPVLLADAFHRYAGQRVYLDVPAMNQVAKELAHAHGLIIQRSFSRMCLGRPIAETVARIWASSGPEMG